MLSAILIICLLYMRISRATFPPWPLMCKLRFSQPLRTWSRSREAVRVVAYTYIVAIPEDIYQSGPLSLDWRLLSISLPVVVTESSWVYLCVRETNLALFYLPEIRMLLGRDKEFLNLCTSFTLDISKARFLINLFPRVLKPYVKCTMRTPNLCLRDYRFVAKVVNTVPKRVEKGLQFLRPMIEEREKLFQEYGADWSDKPISTLSVSLWHQITQLLH